MQEYTYCEHLVAEEPVSVTAVEQQLFSVQTDVCCCVNRFVAKLNGDLEAWGGRVFLLRDLALWLWRFVGARNHIVPSFTAPRMFPEETYMVMSAPRFGEFRYQVIDWCRFVYCSLLPCSLFQDTGPDDVR